MRSVLDEHEKAGEPEPPASGATSGVSRPSRVPLVHRLDVHMREVVAGASITLGMKGLAGVLGFGLNLAVARILGPAGAGVFFLALTLTVIAATVSRLGLDNVVLRFAAAGAGVKQWAEVKGVYRQTIAVALLSASAAGAAIFFASDWIARAVFSKPDLSGPLAIMAFAVPFVSLLNLQGRSLLGIKRIFFAHITNGIALPLLGLFGILLLAPSLGTPGAAAAYTIAAGVAAGSGFVLWRVATPELRGIRGSFPLRTLLDTALPLFGVAVLNLLMEWSATLFLGAWSSAESVGVYNVAHRTAFLVALILTSVNSIAAPKFSELYRKGDTAALASTARNSTRMMIVLAIPALAVLILFPGFVMGLFGAEFVWGAPVLLILAVGQFVNVATGSVGFLLIMCGEERLYRNNMALAAAVNVALNFALVPRYGAVGAAIAMSVSLAVLHLTAAYLVWRRMGIQPIPLSPWDR